MGKFENLNPNISVNVFRNDENDQPYPSRIMTEHFKTNHVYLLLHTITTISHYFLIKKPLKL